MKNLTRHFVSAFAFATVIVAVLAASPAAFADFREQMSGNSQMEREIRWVWKYLGEFSASCTNSPSDCQDPELRAVVVKLNAYLPAYNTDDGKKWADLLQFVSEKDHPELFDSAAGEAHRVVSTKTEKFSVVYVNTDRMELSLDFWCGLLIHEATHHLGYPDDATRLPDRVGTAVGQHFFKQLQSSNLKQFNAPKIRTATFNSLMPNHPSVGFLSWGEWTSDLEWGVTPMQMLCAPNEKMIQEFVSAPAWRVSRFRDSRGVVTIRGGGYVRSLCQNQATGAKQNTYRPLAASVDLQYSVPFDRSNWIHETPKAIYDGVDMEPSPNEGDNLFGSAATFILLSIKHEKMQIQAGQTWRTRAIVRSTDSFNATQCTMYVAGMQYSYLKQDGLPGVNNFDSCKVTKLANQQYQVDGEVVIPASARPDMYYIPVILMQDGVSDRGAIPATPTFLEVVNPGAPPAPVINGIDVKGLMQTTKIGFADITNSYKANAGQTFTVEFTVEGIPTATPDLWFDMDMWFPRPDSTFGILAGTGSSISFPDVLTNTQVTPVSGGTRIVMTFKMPAQVQGIPIAGLKFRRFYVRTSDYSWAEIELPDFRDHMVVSPRYSN